MKAVRRAFQWLFSAAIVRWVSASLALGIWVVLEFCLQSWDIQATCLCCLREAGIREKRVRGIVLSRSMELLEVASSSPSSGGSLDRYREIAGRECTHRFVYRSFCRIDGLFLFRGLARTGGFTAWKLYEPRIQSIRSIFAAFVRMGEPTLAAESYRVVDAAIPLDQEGELYSAQRFRLLCSDISVRAAQDAYPEGSQMADAIERVIQMANRLDQVRSAEAWQRLLIDYQTGEAALRHKLDEKEE